MHVFCEYAFCCNVDLYKQSSASWMHKKLTCLKLFKKSFLNLATCCTPCVPLKSLEN